MTDWNVRIGGSSLNLPVRACSAIWRCNALGQQRRLPRGVDRKRVGNERIELRHDAEPGRLRDAGNTAGQPRKPATFAISVTPIIGEISIKRLMRDRPVSSSASSTYFIASAPPFE